MTELKRNDWVRFQVPDKRVLEGFVQEIGADGSRVKIGKALWANEGEWHDLANITILGRQGVNAPV